MAESELFLTLCRATDRVSRLIGRVAAALDEEKSMPTPDVILASCTEHTLQRCKFRFLVSYCLFRSVHWRLSDAVLGCDQRAELAAQDCQRKRRGIRDQSEILISSLRFFWS